MDRFFIKSTVKVHYRGTMIDGTEFEFICSQETGSVSRERCYYGLATCAHGNASGVTVDHLYSV